MSMLMQIVTLTICFSVCIADMLIFMFVSFLMRCIVMMMNDGPATNADARKRGARSAEFQKGLPPSPEYRNAVTVWIEKAQSIERNTMGR